MAEILQKSQVKIEIEDDVQEKIARPLVMDQSENTTAFDQYVEGILESLKVGETKDHMVKNLVGDQKQNKPTKKNKNYSSSFTIEAILGLASSTKGKKCAHHRLLQKKVYTPAVHLNFMNILSDIRRQRSKIGDNLEHMTECRLCGSCSFSQSKAVAANYMAQHLYTHIPSPIYSCLLCSHYHSSWKPRVQNHIRTTHPYVNKTESAKFIRDHRIELDSCLCSLAVQCYGLYITTG